MSRRKSPAMDPLFDEQDEGRPWGRYALIAAIAGVGGFILYAAFAGGSAPQGPVPVVRADQTPWTRAPSEAGGMEIPNQDSVVYELMDQNGGTEAAVQNPATPSGEELQPPAPEDAAAAGEPKSMDEVMKEATGESAATDLSTATVDKNADKPVEEAAEAPTSVVGQMPSTAAVIGSEDKPVDGAMDNKVNASEDKSVETPVVKTEEKPVDKPVEKIVEEKPARDPDLDAPYNPKAKTATSSSSSTAPVSPAASGKRVTVRLGSMPGTDTSKAAAEFSRLKVLSGGKLTGSASYEPVTLSKGSFVRINTSMDEAAARSLCDTLSSKGAPCLILGQ